MIYGLLGLACPPSHLPDRLTPAYDISFQDLYREYTRFLIEATGELVVLEKCLGNFPDQPSWVADFRQQIPLFLSISTQTSPSPLVPFTHAGRRLTVQGTVSGKVLMVHSSQPDLFTASTKSLINSVEAIASKSCSITHEALDNYLAQTLLSSCRDSLGVDMKTLKQVYNLLGGVNRIRHWKRIWDAVRTRGWCSGPQAQTRAELAVARGRQRVSVQGSSRCHSQARRPALPFPSLLQQLPRTTGARGLLATQCFREKNG